MLVLRVWTQNYNNSLIFATSKPLHWQEIQFNSRRPTSTPLTFFAVKGIGGRCLLIMSARLGHFFFPAWKLQLPLMLMDPAITLHSPCKTCIHPPGASQCDPANWRFCSCSLVAMGKSDAATQWTKSFGGQQESPTQWLTLVQKQWLEITSLLQLHTGLMCFS